MGKDLKGKELGKGISQESTGLYSARFVDRFGKRKHKRFKKLQECRAWIADATYVDEHSDISMPSDMLVDQWFDYWIGIKKKTVRSNTVRNYTERYIKNIKPVICIFRKNCASVPEERSAIPLQTEQSSAG